MDTQERDAQRKREALDALVFRINMQGLSEADRLIVEEMPEPMEGKLAKIRELAKKAKDKANKKAQEMKKKLKAQAKKKLVDKVDQHLGDHDKESHHKEAHKEAHKEEKKKKNKKGLGRKIIDGLGEVANSMLSGV